jgi:hypothetical protein
MQACLFNITPVRNPTFPKSRISVSSRDDRFGLHRLRWVHKLADGIGIDAKEDAPEVGDRTSTSNNL